MLALCLVLSLSSSSILGQFSTAVPEAVVHALANSFNKTVNRLDIATQTDFDESKIIFLDMLDEILKEKWSFRIQLDVDNKAYQSAGDYNLWFVDSYEAFRRLLPATLANKRDEPIFLFIVLKPLTFDISDNLIRKLFSDLFPLMIANVNIVIERNAGEVLFYTFFPYRESACGSTEPVLVNRYANKTMRRSHLFPRKLHNMHGCPIRLAGRNIDYSINVKFKNGRRVLRGMEGELLNEIAVRMNCTLRPSISKILNADEVYSNGTVVGNCKKLLDGEVDFLITFYTHDALKNHLFTASVPYIFTYLVIAFRSPPYKFSKWEWLFGTFDITVWICFSILFAAAAASLIFAKNNAGLRRFFRLQGNRFRILNMVEVTLGMSVNHLPSMNFFRYCFIVTSLGMYVLRTAYEGKLFDSYRRLDAPHTPRTIGELLDQHYSIYSSQKIAPFLISLSGHRNGNIKQNPGIAVIFGTSAKKAALVASVPQLISRLNRTDLEHLVMHNVHAQQFGMFMRKRSIFAPRVNGIILSMARGGLIKRLGERYNFSRRINFMARDAYTPQSITLSQFKYALYLFVSMYLFVIGIFIVELYRGRRLNK